MTIGFFRNRLSRQGLRKYSLKHRVPLLHYNEWRRAWRMLRKVSGNKVETKCKNHFLDIFLRIMEDFTDLTVWNEENFKVTR